ncbi:MFS general substrate transporter [Apiospora phragmitis]|uniref:MFS general substrate transporter n=1 Tax=Apiospora phragmitis TaxID=2905665 RepID=A0ABR1TAN8_9PEZI
MVLSSSPNSYDESPYLRDSPDDTGSGSSPRSGRRRQRAQSRSRYPDDIEDDIGSPMARTSSPIRQRRDWQRQAPRRSTARSPAHQLPALFPSQHARGSHGGSGASQADVEMSDLNDAHNNNSASNPFVDPDVPPEPVYRSRSRRESRYAADPPMEQRRARSQSRNRRQSRSITSNGSSRGPPRYNSHSRTPSRARQLRRLSEDYEEAYENQIGAPPLTPRTARGSVRGSTIRGGGGGVEPFPPLPDARPLTMSPAEEDLEDPRVRVLLEALRITTAQEAVQPPPETARGSIHPIVTRTRPRDNSHAEQGLSPNEKFSEDSTWYSNDDIDEKSDKLDKNLVDWDGPDDPACPSNWPMMKKYKTSLILSMFSFIAPFSATMVGPAIDVIGAELNIAPGAEQRLIMGMQVLAAGLGPAFIAPLLEYFGRAPVIRYAHLWHMLWNTACGFATSGPQLLAFRFIGGLGASAPSIIAPGLTADVYPAPIGGRGDAVHAYLPFLGSALAPIFGAAIAEYTDWRWIFWATSMFSTVAIVLAFAFLEETLHPLLLSKKCKRLKQSTGNQALHTPYQVPGQSTKEWMMKKIALPYVMLICHPTVQLAFGYRAYLFGIMYLFISTFDKNFETLYKMDKISASLNILSLGAGFVLGLHISRYAIDGWSAYFRKKHNTSGHRPEWRLPVNSGAALLIPPSLILYGWALEKKMHYIVPDLAAFFLAIGLILGFFSLQPYVTESYGAEYAASAHAAGTFMQHTAEFAFPLLGPPIYADLGQGWGSTLMAVVTLSIAIFMPLVLWHFGPALRRASSRGLPVEASARR